MRRKEVGNRVVLVGVAAILSAVPVTADAHVWGGAGAGLWAGMAHPVNGIDHLLAMVAVGLWAARLGGQNLWRLPAAFIVAMVAGAGLAWIGVPLIQVELGVAGSVVLLGVVVACGLGVPSLVGIGFVGLFAIFHGHAHGGEATVAASALPYMLGFAITTAALHGSGVLAGLAARDAPWAGWLVRGSGAAIAGAGVLMLPF